MAAKLNTPAAGRYAVKANAEINVTPFVDVMLVLLIIFMVAAPMATTALHVDLPPPVPSPSQAEPTFISISDAGEISVSGRPSSLVRLGGDLPAAVRASGVTGDVYDERVYIRADADVPYDQFMAVMNRLETLGWRKVGIIAEEIS